MRRDADEAKQKRLLQLEAMLGNCQPAKKAKASPEVKTDEMKVEDDHLMMGDVG